MAQVPLARNLLPTIGFPVERSAEV